MSWNASRSSCGHCATSRRRSRPVARSRQRWPPLRSAGGPLRDLHQERRARGREAVQDRQVQRRPQVVRVGGEEGADPPRQEHVQAPAARKGGIEVAVARRAPFQLRLGGAGCGRPRRRVHLRDLVLEQVDFLPAPQFRVALPDELPRLAPRVVAVEEQEERPGAPAALPQQPGGRSGPGTSARPFTGRSDFAPVQHPCSSPGRRSASGRRFGKGARRPAPASPGPSRPWCGPWRQVGHRLDRRLRDPPPCPPRPAAHSCGGTS